ncbi:bifunctional 2-polyprenyl-6-hydroxyphenol methylase/3-demethylubiquinol 3-O-methyltransferase UbiG [Microbacterium sp. SD291]|uniref:class I SAM-dependent methyltransferase n=1 Tax=Microbacterium sp. SD291 TaxID=2782007 RepID=UPI001A9668D7|nr:class I SAM-dependent methyltransferase [Microbacterium sp. SD291]MBO0979271.1 class I SAM-dependent methyltransferase [Microbacterium sp. SD291]
MDDCCASRTPGGYDREFDDRFARRLAREYRRRGLTPTAQRMVEFASAAGVEGASILEIGGGIGDIQLELLKRGAAKTTNLELSGAYEREARRLLDEAGLGARAERMLGVDIAAAPGAVGRADFVVLHRVVCCYPDYARLLSAAAEHARRAIVFSHPPRTWTTRAGVAAVNTWCRVLGHEYRGFVHSPESMVEVLESHGFAPRYRHSERAWRIVGAERR